MAIKNVINLTRIEELPLVNQNEMCKAYNSLYEYYKMYNNDERNEKITYEEFLKFINIDTEKRILDYKVNEIIEACRKARKLAFKNDTMSRKELMEIWCEIIKKRSEFELAQSFLHTEMEKCFMISPVDWLKLIGVNGRRFEMLNEKAILEIKENVDWFIENQNPMVVFKCDACEGIGYYYLKNEDRLKSRISDAMEDVNREWNEELFCEDCCCMYEDREKLEEMIKEYDKMNNQL